ncbi:MAG TPA: hypothetical protein VH134_07955 [Candidatus Dormibacteraeota bacterium]|nr:hypothetical protein [Candidatus Dormibacteraeota bacterium]
MNIRRVIAVGIASTALLGGLSTGAGSVFASTAHSPHNKCVPAGSKLPGTPCKPKPKTTHTPKPKPTHIPKPKPSHVPNPHTSHPKTSPTPVPGH